MDRGTLSCILNACSELELELWTRRLRFVVVANVSYKAIITISYSMCEKGKEQVTK